MSKFLLVFFAVAAMTQTSHAQEVSYEQEQLSQDTEVEIMSMNERRPGHGGGWGPGRPGPGRPGHGRPDPYPQPGRPGPRPGPPGPRPPSQPYPPYPPPYPPPAYRTEYIQCGAWDYRYNECFVNPYRVQSVRLYQQNSYDACIYGRTWGFNYDRLWTSGGCRGTFVIERY